MTDHIRRAHDAGRQHYGAPRVHKSLIQNGIQIGLGRVARLMRKAGIQGTCSRLQCSHGGTKLRKYFAKPSNLRIDHPVTGLNQTWCMDVTYLRVGHLWHYLATIIDVHSRRVIAYRLGPDRTAGLTSQTFVQAVQARRPPAGLILHTDRGIEFLANEFQQTLNLYNARHSANRPWRMNDNAHIETFFHSLKSEGLFGIIFTPTEQLMQAVDSYICFYNTWRLHSSIGYLSPIHFELTCQAKNLPN